MTFLCTKFYLLTKKQTLVFFIFSMETWKKAFSLLYLIIINICKRLHTIHNITLNAINVFLNYFIKVRPLSDL